jgi:cytochrome b involved in lipid metabolism
MAARKLALGAVGTTATLLTFSSLNPESTITQSITSQAPFLKPAIAFTSSTFFNSSQQQTNAALSSKKGEEDVIQNLLASKKGLDGVDVPLMTIEDMRVLVEEQERIVVSFNGKVFDVTDFTGHPGGYGRLEMVAGSDLAPFWTVYTQHNRGHVLDFLQRYKIGYLSPEEAKQQVINSGVFEHPYSDDPEPYDTLLTNTRYPYNAEGKLREMTDNFITPIGKHYVRNHGLVPNIDVEDYRLTITGVGCKTMVYSLKELK